MAALVFCLIAWGPVSPLAIASAGDPVPECCRRDGKHHCMMMAMAGMGADTAGSPRASTKPDPCPYRSLRATPAATAITHNPSRAQCIRESSELVPAFRGIRLQLCDVSAISPRGPPDLDSRLNS